ncbi:MAG: SDR family NAD(P)-dependent oxidoreductase [Candidatus Hydrogenedentes bacterium]|nr:SDR family NAD(P)-dependent oxidoreductase [Candidatus Hydrogenedentota bacterium]
MEIKGQKVLVTGGSAGIGYATAAALVQHGCKVVINGRDASKLKAAAEKLGCGYAAGDVSVEADAKRTVKEAVAQLDGIDVLVNNAGFGRFGTLLDLEADDMEAVWRTNVLGAMFMAREVAKHLVEQRSGTIINIASTAGTKGFAGGTAYASSKFALRGMTECWREELRREDVRVVLINPSEVITEFASRAGYAQEDSDKKLHAEDIAQAVVSVLEMGPRALVTETTVIATNPF